MPPEELTPTLSNFDAIVAAKAAAAEAADDSDGRETLPPPPPPPDETEDDDADPEADEDDEGDEGDEGEDDSEADDESEADDATPEVRAPLKAVRAALKAGKVTPELLEALGDLPWEIDTPQGKATIPLREMQRHVMREARFHRELAKTREDQEKAQRIVDFERARTNAWRGNPDEIRRGLVAMGLEDQLEQMFWGMAREKHAYGQMSPEDRHRVDMQRLQQRAQQQIAIERQQREALENRLRQQAQPAQELDEQSQAAFDHVSTNLDKALQTAFKQAGVKVRVDDGYRTKFAKVFKQLTQEYDFPNLDDAIGEAAGIVADQIWEVKELARRSLAEERRKAPKELPPRAAARGPAKAQTPQQRTDRKANGKAKPTAAEFARRFGM